MLPVAPYQTILVPVYYMCPGVDGETFFDKLPGGYMAINSGSKKDFKDFFTKKQISTILECSPILKGFLPALDVIYEVNSPPGMCDQANHLRRMYKDLKLQDEERVTLLNFMQPEFNEADLTVSYYRDGTGLVKGHKVTTKIGKFVRALVPDKDMSDAWIERRVNILKDCFFQRVFTIKEGKEREDFKHAYSHTQAKYRDPRTTDYRKSLANSCMKYSFDGGPHPAEYYASGDFTIIWLEDEQGQIAARTIVGNKHHAPIYGACEQSIDMLTEYLQEKGIEPDRGGYWFGLTLLVIPNPSDSNTVMAAYLDDYGYVSDKDDHLVISRSGMYAKHHEGVFYRNTIVCTECGEDLDGLGHTCSNYVGDAYCECCYDAIYTHCEVDGGEIYRDDSVLVQTYSRSNSWEIIVHQDYAVETEEDGWWLGGDTIELVGGAIYPIDSPSVVQSDFSSRYFHVDDTITTDDGSVGSQEELEKEGYVYDEELGEWIMPEGEQECKTATA